MSANATTAAPTGRKKLAQGKEQSGSGVPPLNPEKAQSRDGSATLGHDSPNTSSPEGAKEGGELPVGWKWKTIPDLVGEHGVFIDGDWVESKDGDVLIARMPDPLGRACLFPGDAKPSVTVVDVAIVRSGNGEFDHRWLTVL